MEDAEKKEAVKKLGEKEEEIKKDIKSNGKALGIYSHNEKRIFERYETVKTMYLNPSDHTEEEAELKAEEGRSYLASPEIVRYNILVKALEDVFQNPEWKKNDEGTKMHPKQDPVPV